MSEAIQPPQQEEQPNTVAAPEIQPMQPAGDTPAQNAVDVPATQQTGDVEQIKQADPAAVAAVERMQAMLKDAIARLQAKRPNASVSSAEAAARVSATGASPDDANRMLAEVSSAESDVSARDISATMGDVVDGVAKAATGYGAAEEVSGASYFSALDHGLGGMMDAAKLAGIGKGGKGVV